jgi:hypothetical protein
MFSAMLWFSYDLLKKVCMGLRKKSTTKKKRGVWFKAVVQAIRTWEILDCIPHPNQKQSNNQRYLIVLMKWYPYVCPCVITENEIFSKQCLQVENTSIYFCESNNDWL